MTLPFGDAYIVNTPQTDRVVASLYQEQKLRQAKQEAENKALDDAMSKEFANVRSADMPDVAEAWNAYKEKRKKVLFDKKLKDDNVAYVNANRDAQMALSDVYGIINKSKEVKQSGEDLRKSWYNKPDLYTDDFGQKYSAFASTPVKQLHQVQVATDAKGQPVYEDLSDLNNFRYNGADYNALPALEKARGAEVAKEIDLGNVDAKGLQQKIGHYKMYGNSPEKFKENFLSVLADRKANKFYNYQLEHTSPEEVASVEQKFNNLDWNELSKYGIKNLT
jgi:hypothetical protein